MRTYLAVSGRGSRFRVWRRAWLLLLLSCAGSTAVAQPHVDPAARVQKFPSAPAASVENHVRVPNLVGLNVLTAQERLAAAGYTMKFQSLYRADRSKPLGEVVAQTPKAGTPQVGGEVEVQVPLASIITGTGLAGVDATREGTGYDLDHVTQALISNGSDVVVRHHDARPSGASAPGDAAGDYLEPVNGAILVRAPLISPDALVGNYLSYVACSNLLREHQAAHLPSSLIRLDDATLKNEIVLCALTSEKQIAELQVGGQPEAPRELSYYFAFALFPYQSVDFHRPAVDLTPRH